MKTFAALLSAFAILLLATPTHADPLTLRGAVTIDGSFDAPFTAHLITDEFDLTLREDTSVWPGNTGCFHCRPGDTLDLRAFLSANLVFATSGTIQGVSYPSLGSDGWLQFLGSTQLPAGQAGDTATLTAPFTVSGHLGVAHTGNEALNGQYFYTADVAGQGSVMVSMIGDTRFPVSEPAHWMIRNATYTFESADPSPTPEPASLLLIGIGLAAIQARRRGKGNLTIDAARESR
jgi:hypothetical protein